MSDCQEIVCCPVDPYSYSLIVPPVFYNTEQCFTANCPDGETGSPKTVCMAAGTYSGPTQGEADSAAYAAAQQAAIAELSCSGTGCVNLIPNMTSNTTPTGIAAASSFRLGHDAWKAFDGDLTAGSIWQSNSLPAWLRYGFAIPQVIQAYKIWTIAVFTGAVPRGWVFEGSTDLASWTALDTRAAQVFVDLVPNTYSFVNGVPYSYYRIRITDTTNNALGSVIIAELQMFPCQTP